MNTTLDRDTLLTRACAALRRAETRAGAIHQAPSGGDFDGDDFVLYNVSGELARFSTGGGKLRRKDGPAR